MDQINIDHGKVKVSQCNFRIESKQVVARIVFAVPAASSKSERVFSVAGNTVTPKRACLAPNKVEHLVTIKTNLRLLRQFVSKI